MGCFDFMRFLGRLFFVGFLWLVLVGRPVLVSAYPNLFLVQLRSDTNLTHHIATNIDSSSNHIKYTYSIGPDFKGYAIHLAEEHDLYQLQSNSDVLAIEKDGVAKTADCQLNAPWHLQRVSQVNYPTTEPSYPYIYGPLGHNLSAYIVDTALDPTHPDFGGRAVIGASFASGTNGHATHVAGLVGSNTYGVMKECQLLGVTVLDGTGQGAWSTIVAGIQWAYDDWQVYPKTAVINLSIGGAQSDFVNAAVSAVVSQGLTVVVAAGNAAVDASTTSPASAQGVIVVGASDLQNLWAPFSNYGSTLTLLAPGVAILSTWLDGDSAYLSGTSMAAPLVAGTVLTYLSWLPRLSPANVKRKLLKDTVSGEIVNVPPGTTSAVVNTGLGANATDECHSATLLPPPRIIQSPPRLCVGAARRPARLHRFIGRRFGVQQPARYH
jgi:subtilisin family serine protease